MADNLFKQMDEDSDDLEEIDDEIEFCTPVRESADACYHRALKQNSMCLLN